MKHPDMSREEDQVVLSPAPTAAVKKDASPRKAKRKPKNGG
jgi:hypothetical protein